MQTYSLLHRPRISKDDLSLFCFIPIPLQLAQLYIGYLASLSLGLSSLCVASRGLPTLASRVLGCEPIMTSAQQKSSVFFTLFCSMHCSFRLVIDSKIDSSGYDWLWSRVLRICKKKLSRIKTEGMANVAIKAMQ